MSGQREATEGAAYVKAEVWEAARARAEKAEAERDTAREYWPIEVRLLEDELNRLRDGIQALADEWEGVAAVTRAGLSDIEGAAWHYSCGVAAIRLFSAQALRALLSTPKETP